MTLDEQRVSAGGQCRDRERRNPPRIAGGMARIDGDREVGHVAEHRDRAHVKRVPCRRLERADAALAEDDLVVALGGDVVRCREPLVVGRGHAALEDDRHAALPRGAQQRGVVHRARSDEQRVGMAAQQLDVIGGEWFRDHR